VVVRYYVDDCGFVVGAVLEDSKGTIEANGDEFAAIGRVGEEGWAGSVWEDVSSVVCNS